jgi:hypothetical protein
VKKKQEDEIFRRAAAQRTLNRFLQKFAKEIVGIRQIRIGLGSDGWCVWNKNAFLFGMGDGPASAILSPHPHERSAECHAIEPGGQGAMASETLE